VAVVYLDFSKAFHMVSHSTILPNWRGMDWVNKLGQKLPGLFGTGGDQWASTQSVQEKTEKTVIVVTQ